MGGWPAAAGLRAAGRHAGSGAQARRLTGAAAANTRATQVRVREGSNTRITGRGLPHRGGRGVLSEGARLPHGGGRPRTRRRGGLGRRRQVRRHPPRALLQRAARACCLVPIGVAGLNAAPVVAGRHQSHGRRACCGRRGQPRTAEPGTRLRARRWWPRPAHRQAPLGAGRPCAAATTAWRTSR